MDLTLAMRLALQEAAYTAKDEEGDQIGLNTWLVGLQGVGLWEIDTKWHAARMTMTAIGSCFEFATGWLANDVCRRYDPDTQIRECIRAAAKTFSGAVRTPALVIGPVVER
jgi:hypothetical protein